MDYTGPYSKCENTGNRYILVITEPLTKYVITAAVPEQTAERAAVKIFEVVICVWGLPKIIQTDGGSHFTSKLITEIYKLFQVMKVKASSYRPQSQGIVEVTNGILIGMLARVGSEQINRWDQFLAPVVLAYNTSKHSVTRETPHFLMTGRRCRLPADIAEFEVPVLEAKDSEILSNMAKRIQMAQDSAKMLIEEQQVVMKEKYDMGAKETEFEVGRWFW